MRHFCNAMFALSVWIGAAAFVVAVSVSGWFWLGPLGCIGAATFWNLLGSGAR